MTELQQIFGAGDTSISTLPKLHTYVFLGTELIGIMTADCTIMIVQHIYQPALHNLQLMIPWDILDVTDAWRTLNPYWALWQFSDGKAEQEDYRALMFERMNALRRLGEDRQILYIESIYVREDCRRHGIFRMYIDFLRSLFPGGILWLNMEPTSGEEMETEYTCVPIYTVSELGQCVWHYYIT